MIYLYLALLLVPAGAIFVWGKLVSQFSVRTWAVYKSTGLIGGPVHELAHAIACVIFGLRIRKLALYSPDAISGRLGYVEFSYSPFSLRNSIGLVVQGIAPLLAGGAIAVLVLGTTFEQQLPDQGLLSLVGWIGSIAVGAVTSLVEIGLSSLQGFLLAVLVLVVCMHAIPSTADIKVGLKGLAILALGFAGLIFLLQMAKIDGDAMALVTNGMDAVSHYLELGMWHALYGAVLVVAISVVANIVLIIIPASLFRVKAFWDGARGKFE